MALSKDTPLVQELGNVNEHPVAATVKIYEGGAVGVNVSTGHARPLVAGDQFLGFAERQADNSAGSSGAEITVRVIARGRVKLAVASLAITDLTAAVYASDDGTFTLVAGANSFIGRVARFISSGVGIVSFDAENLGETPWS